MQCYTPNANMAERSVGARDESNESEASQALIIIIIMALFSISTRWLFIC